MSHEIFETLIPYQINEFDKSKPNKQRIFHWVQEKSLHLIRPSEHDGTLEDSFQ